MKNKYIGITLGPIQNTLELSSTPAGLWAASYLFSKMAKDICQELLDTGIQQREFLSPYFELKQEGKALSLPETDEIDLMVLMKKGVGFFHDRIIYGVNDDEQKAISDAQCCIEKVKNRFCESILKQMKVESGSWDEEKQNLLNYFQIYTVCTEVEETKSPIISVASTLDHLENEHNFWTNTKRDYLWEILSNNENVKNSWMAKGLESWQLIDDIKQNNILNITKLGKRNPALSEVKKKKYSYFALVQADGDQMGKLLGSLKTREEIREFSKKCLIYTAKCAQRILEYGGIVIYAGGDDLLFLAPVESYKSWDEEEMPRKKNILELLEELKEIFLKEDFKSNTHKVITPTLSFGLSIQYHKFPLYEALKNGGNLLFGEAKTKGKDALAIQLRKHSGKRADFLIPTLSETTEITNIAALANGKESVDLITSVLRHIVAYETIFIEAIKEKKKDIIKNVFVNLLIDSMDDTQNADLSEIDRLISILEAVVARENNPDKSKEIFTSILRYIKFFGEDREEDETDEEN